MSDDPVTNVSIFGTEYKISSAVDPERTQRVARLVDRQMREVASSLFITFCDYDRRPDGGKSGR